MNPVDVLTAVQAFQDAHGGAWPSRADVHPDTAEELARTSTLVDVLRPPRPIPFGLNWYFDPTVPVGDIRLS